MPWARASALDRHLECAAASWYPRVDRGVWKPSMLPVVDATRPPRKLPDPPEDDGVLAQWGTEMHLAKEGSPDAADPWVSWMEPHRAKLWPEGLGKHERAVAYDCSTGRVEVYVGPKADADQWKESQGDNFVTGTLDWLAELPSGEPWVDDLKTGYHPPSVTGPQMLFYGLVASKYMDSLTVRLSITHWRRGWEQPERYWQQVGPATLEAFQDELHAAWKRAARGDGPNGGPWCRYCPSQLVCSAVTGSKE